MSLSNPVTRAAVAAEIIAGKDWPRLALLLAWFKELLDYPGIPGNATSNHEAQIRAARLLQFGKREDRDWMVADLNRQVEHGLQHGEQGSSIYGPFYPAAVTAARRWTMENGDAELLAACDRWLAAWMGFADLVSCPMKSHQSVAGRRLTPGCRSGDHLGRDLRQDVMRLGVRGASVPWRMPSDDWQSAARANWMEVELVFDAIAKGWLPPVGAFLPRLRSAMTVERYANGHRAWCDDLHLPHAGFPVWSVAVRYSDGATASVSWKDVQPPPKKPKLMGGGPAPELPANLPGLGDLISTVTLDKHTALPEGSKKPLPDPKPKPPPDPKPKPKPGPEPKPGGRWEHRKIAIDNGEIIVRVQPPDAEVEFLRRHK